MKRVTLAAALSLGLLGLAPAGPVESAAPPVTVTAPTQVLKKGCAQYHYSYRIDVDTRQDDWLLQVQIADAGGTNQAFQFFTSGDPGDPMSATSTFQLCSANVHAPGMFTISGELDLNNGTSQRAIVYTPVHFRIAPAPSKHKVIKHKHKKKHHKKKKAKKRHRSAAHG